ncbi:MAG: MotA/TolQ/ExbB proton channel family protein [Polaromonas sp.]|nr:MotA/TolQ/ExbB proton channel family protein [Polaromonas sp.]
MTSFSTAPHCLYRHARSSTLAALLAVTLLLNVIPAGAQTQLSTALREQTGAVAGASTSAVVSPDARPGVTTATPVSSSANPYGLAAIWSQGDWVAKGCLLLLALMSTGSWYVLVVKSLELKRLRAQTRDALGAFVDVRHFASSVAKLGPDNPLRFVADSGSVAVQQYASVKPRVDYDTWLIRAIEQALSALQIRMQGGMAVLATIGSTAPFVGLFGTVWAIYSALIKIGASGQASIDRVAGPVGEALIMTAIGLAVAVPAVFGYNWLLRQNKLALESVRGFGARLHIMLLATSDGAEAAKPSSIEQAR